MDTITLLVAVTGFVTVLILVITNSQSVSTLKKSVASVTAAAAVSVPALSHGILVRDLNGNYAPKRSFYVRLIPTASLPNVPPPAGDPAPQPVDVIAVAMNDNVDGDGRALAREIEKGRVACVYRPEKRVLYNVLSAAVYEGAGWSDMVSAGGVSTGTDLAANDGYLLLRLVKNSGEGTEKMFTEDDIPPAGLTDAATRQTIVAVPSPMPGNSVSGV